MRSKTDQRGAQAGADIVGRDKIVHNYPATEGPGPIEQLLQKLQAEIENDEKIKHTIENLKHFTEHKSKDGIIGLEAKLIAGKREYELYSAFAKKELFAKLLETWSHYYSAQEIFAFLLAKIEYEFSMFVFPNIQSLTQHDINQLISDRIVLPTIQECGSGVFTLNHSIVMGMVYWLAEQCFVRWHQ
jgi:predicted metallopeptidase